MFLTTGAVTVLEALRADRATEPSILKCRDDDISQWQVTIRSPQVTSRLASLSAGREGQV